MSLRDEVKEAQDIRIEPIELPDWPGEGYHVKTMTGRERDAFDQHTFDKEIPEDERKLLWRATVTAWTVCDADGALIFGPDDVGWLAEKSGAMLQIVFDVSCRLNRLLKEDIEDLAKN